MLLRTTRRGRRRYHRDTAHVGSKVGPIRAFAVRLLADHSGRTWLLYGGRIGSVPFRLIGLRLTTDELAFDAPALEFDLYDQVRRALAPTQHRSLRKRQC